MHTKKLSKQVILFGVAGVFSACIQTILMKILTQPNILPSLFLFENLYYSYPISNAISNFGGIISNYYFSIIFSIFKRGKHSKHKEMRLFIIFSIFTALLNYLLFSIFIRIFKQPIINLGFISFGNIVFSTLLAIFFSSLVNFFVKKKLIFHN